VETDFDKAPDYVEPFVAYRVWNLTDEGITSLNGVLWTPKQAFEATCNLRDDWKSMYASVTSDEARKFWKATEHCVPDPGCTCGMYAGINMQHLIDIDYIERGIHGEVYLWGRLYRHSLGWRAQYAYPKYFVVPTNRLPFNIAEIQERLEMLVNFDVDIYLQKDKTPTVTGEKIPLWVKDYGYSQQGISFLIEKRKKWYDENPPREPRAPAPRVCALG
jgi:hypothetical protein